MLDEVLQARARESRRSVLRPGAASAAKRRGGIEAGARCAVFLASEAARGITGRLISAVWDRYEDWPAHLQQLGASDAYTLRRISGHERGFDWGDN